MIALGVRDCSVTKGQHPKAIVLLALWSYGTAIAGNRRLHTEAVNE
jgi:hypothetical protein